MLLVIIDAAATGIVVGGATAARGATVAAARTAAAGRRPMTFPKLSAIIKTFINILRSSLVL